MTTVSFPKPTRAKRGVLPFSLKKAVIKYRFHGYGRNDAARKVKRTHPSFSPASATNIVDEFESVVQEKGLQEAAEVYGVKVEIDSLFEISETLRENK